MLPSEANNPSAQTEQTLTNGLFRVDSKRLTMDTQAPQESNGSSGPLSTGTHEVSQVSLSGDRVFSDLQLEQLAGIIFDAYHTWKQQ